MPVLAHVWPRRFAAVRAMAEERNSVQGAREAEYRAKLPRYSHLLPDQEAARMKARTSALKRPASVSARPWEPPG